MSTATAGATSPSSTGQTPRAALIEEELVRQNVPYRVVGGARFYERREVKDMLAYLHSIANPDDEVSLKRILNVPRRGIGETSIGRLGTWAAEKGMPFAEALAHAREAGVTGKALTGIGSFLTLMGGLRAMLGGWPEPERRRRRDRPGGRRRPAGRRSCSRPVLDRTGYLEELRAEGGARVEVEGRVENVEELIGAAREVVSVADFLTEVSLVADADEVDGDDSSLTLMTLHTAKGLEYPVVFIAGMEEGIFPHLRPWASPMSSKRSGAFAMSGVTRAKERLYLSYAWCRSLWGDAQYNPPSRFLSEIPEHLVRTSGARTRRERLSRAEARSELVEAAMRRGRAGMPVQGTGAEALGLRAGDGVVHGRYGEGVVLEVNGEGADAEATIRFPGVGEKRFSLHLTPLKRA